MTQDAIERSTFGFRPLYMQVRDVMMSRLIDGIWKPGTIIPSEIDLAREMDVSQGTVRKALDSMTAENLLVRRQGRGTFVAEMEESNILFQFFRLESDATSGSKNFPESQVVSVSSRNANEFEMSSLKAEVGEKIWHVERRRLLDGQAVVVESIFAKESSFPALGDTAPMPNNLYRLYSETYGKTIAKADEKLKAINANANDAKHLNCEQGTALLLIERIGFGLNGEPLELRLSRCLTANFHYRNTLR